jgi:hypothetical protein
MYTKTDPKAAFWTKMGSTEQMKDNLNPDFETSFYVDYYFEKHQPIKFEIVDDDGSGKAELIGDTETLIGTIMGAKG